MRTYYDSGKGKSVPTSYGVSSHDDEPWFAGKKLADVSSGDIASKLIDLGVTGASHNNGRAANLELWAKHLDQIRQAAADKAVAEFIAGKSA